MKLQSDCTSPNGMLALGMGLAAAAILASSVPAGAQTVYRLQQDIASNNRDAEEILWIENNRDEPVLLTLEVLTREMGAQGQEVNLPTSDFSVFPRQTMMGARQMQVVRLQWRGPDNPDRELSYRLLAVQEPLPVSPTKANRVKIAFRYLESVYVVPPSAAPDVVVESARAVKDAQKGPALELVLNNRGSAHALIDEPALTINAGGVARKLDDKALASLDGQNVLARSKRTLQVAWPEGVPFAQPKVEFKFTPTR